MLTASHRPENPIQTLLPIASSSSPLWPGSRQPPCPHRPSARWRAGGWLRREPEQMGGARTGHRPVVSLFDESCATHGVVVWPRRTRSRPGSSRRVRQAERCSSGGALLARRVAWRRPVFEPNPANGEYSAAARTDRTGSWWSSSLGGLGCRRTSTFHAELNIRFAQFT